MTQELKDRILVLVRDEQGVQTAIAVYAALEVAEQHWSEADTKEFGTMARDIVLGRTQ